MIFLIALTKKDSLPIIALFPILSIDFVSENTKEKNEKLENFIKKMKSESDSIEEEIKKNKKIKENENLEKFEKKYCEICDFYKNNINNINQSRFNELFKNALNEKIDKIKIFLRRFYGYYYEENGIKTILDSHKSHKVLEEEIKGKEIKYLFPFAQGIKDDFLPELTKFINDNNDDFFKLFDFIFNSVKDFEENLKDFCDEIKNSQLLITPNEDLDEKRKDSVATKYFFAIKSRCISTIWGWSLNNQNLYDYLSATKVSAIKKNKNIKLFYSNTAFFIDNNTLKEALDYMAHKCKTDEQIEEKMNELKEIVNKNIKKDSDSIKKEINELKNLFLMRSDVFKKSNSS